MQGALEDMRRDLLTDILYRNGMEVIAMLVEKIELEEMEECLRKEMAEVATKEATNLMLARVEKLNKILLSQKKYGELKKASDDPAYLTALLDSYGI